MAETETVEMIGEDDLPGQESKLEPKPDWAPFYPGSGRLQGKVALVTGADSGIGRAGAALFAREGADIAVLYLCEHDGAKKTKEIVEAEGRRAITIPGDLGDKDFCDRAVNELLDYSATRGAITAFTRSLSENLVGDGIRVNAVAPGPIWTPLNPCGGSTPDKMETFGESTPMGRPGQPNEVAPSFLFLACDDSRYMSGQVLHPNGGTIVNG